MFEGFIKLKPSCEVCGLDLSVADTGDGPSFFASFIGSVIILGAAVYAQIVYEPPFWVYVVLLLFGGLLVVGLIRPLKGILAALQFTNKAAQGRIEP
jgi:uncharacterized protein (DUF983 family)